MEVIYGRVKDILNPNAHIVAVKIGDILLIQEYDPEELLKEVWRKFEDLSDEEKVQVALEAKRWVRKR